MGDHNTLIFFCSFKKLFHKYWQSNCPRSEKISVRKLVPISTKQWRLSHCVFRLAGALNSWPKLTKPGDQHLRMPVGGPANQSHSFRLSFSDFVKLIFALFRLKLYCELRCTDLDLLVRKAVMVLPNRLLLLRAPSISTAENKFTVCSIKFQTVRNKSSLLLVITSSLVTRSRLHFESCS